MPAIGPINSASSCLQRLTKPGSIRECVEVGEGVGLGVGGIHGLVVSVLSNFPVEEVEAGTESVEFSPRRWAGCGGEGFTRRRDIARLISSSCCTISWAV